MTWGMQMRTPALEKPAPQISWQEAKQEKPQHYTSAAPVFQPADDYIRIGPGSWQHMGAVAGRIVSRLSTEAAP